jgi:serine/threonine protein kinase
MKCLQSFGVMHGGLKPCNVLFDESHRIQIADFWRSRLDAHEGAATAHRVESKFEPPWTQSGVFSFALTLFEIVIDLPALRRTIGSQGFAKLPVNACERIEIPEFVPKFVSVLIDS